MSDERYYTVQARFDPSVFVTLEMPWQPTAGGGQDPSDMRQRRLTTSRAGRFRPEVLGRKSKSTSSLVQVWTDGPVELSDRYYVLGSDATAESNPPSVQRGLAASLTTSPGTAELLELGPTDQLAIATSETTTCYIRVIDLDEEQLARWLCEKASTLPQPVTSGLLEVSNADEFAAIDIPATNVDQLTVQVTALAQTVLRLPTWASARPGQEITVVREQPSGDQPNDTLVFLVPASGDDLNLQQFELFLPLRGLLRVRRGAATLGPNGLWSGMVSITGPREDLVDAGDLELLYGWPGLRIVRLTEAAAQTVTLPPYGLPNTIPLGCTLRVSNPTGTAKTGSASAGELITGLGAQALTVSIPAQTIRDFVFDGNTWTVI